MISRYYFGHIKFTFKGVSPSSHIYDSFLILNLFITVGRVKKTKMALDILVLTWSMFEQS